MKRTSFDFRLSFLWLFFGIGVNAVKTGAKDNEAVLQYQARSVDIPMCPGQKNMAADSCDHSLDNFRCGNGWGCPSGYTCCLDECKKHKCQKEVNDNHCRYLSFLWDHYSCPHMYELQTVFIFNICCKTDSPCFETADPGNCVSAEQRYYYNKVVMECQTFFYTGCGGNDNRFTNQQSCEEACSACSFDKEDGECDGRLPRWYYDVDGSKCKPFMYSGCGGNINNFANKKDCEDYCMSGQD